MKKIVFLFFSLIQISLFGQDINDFNKLYYKTYVETSQSDFQAAIKVADSLYTISESPLLKTRSLMLSASLYKQSGEVKKSIDYALRSGEIIRQTDNYNWQAKVYGFLASEYRLLKLYDNSKQYFEKAFEASKNIEDPKTANNVKGLMLQEKAYYEIEKKNYRKAIVEINKSQQFFELAVANFDYFTANNEQLLGLSYFNLKEFDRSLKHYNAALKFTQKDSGSFLSGIIYSGLAQLYLEQKDLKNAKKYLDLAKKIAKKSSYLELKNEILTTSSKYYAATKEFEKLSDVKVQQDSVKEKIATQSTSFINQSFTALQKDNKIVEDKNSEKSVLIALAALFIVLSSIYFVFYRRKQKRDLQHFREIIKNIEANNSIVVQKNIEQTALKAEFAQQEKLSVEKSEPSVTMTVEMEQKILSKLKDFEEAELYLENTISLATLATYCEANSNYLSQIINAHKKQDFYNYINELRIGYIVKKLANFSVYRKYKIAVLAKEAGFSSQNKFSTVFKKVTTITPSVYIKYLQENKKT